MHFQKKLQMHYLKNKFLYKIKIICFDRIDAPGGTDVDKISKSRDCDNCHYWYSLNKGFKFQLQVCNSCQDLLQMYMNRSDIAILKIKNADYCCIVSGISKRDTIKLMQNIDSTEKSKTL